MNLVSCLFQCELANPFLLPDIQIYSHWPLKEVHLARTPFCHQNCLNCLCRRLNKMLGFGP